MKFLVAGLLLVSLLAGCADGIEDFDPVEAPEWKAGYAYAYDVVGRIQAEGVEKVDGKVVDQDKTDERFGPEPAYTFQVISTSTEHQGEPIYLAAARIQSTMMEELMVMGEGPLVVRQRDLETLGASMSGPATMTIDDADALETYLDFPLTPGKTWSNGFGGGHVEDAEFAVLMTSKAMRMEPVDAGASKVGAVVVQSKLSVPELSQAIRQGEAQMREAGMQDVDVGMTVKGSMTTWYAPSLAAVAKESLRMQIEVDMRFTADGHNVHLRAALVLDMLMTLAGADLSPQADRDKAAALAFISSGAPINDPTGRLDAPMGTYQLVTKLDRERVNAAEDGRVAVSVDAVGGLPEGHTVQYALRNAAGETVLTGEGTDFSLDISDPGAYSLRVRAYDGDALQAQDAVAVTADWARTVPVACTVAVGAMQACQSQAIPSGLDLQHARITYEGGSATGLLPLPGTLVLEDGRGGTVEAEAMNGRATIDVRDFTGLDPTNGWTVTWQPTVGVAEQGTFDILMEYGPSPADDGGMLKRMLGALELRHLDLLGL